MCVRLCIEVIEMSKIIWRWFSRAKLKYLFVFFVVFTIFYVSGLLTRLFEKDVRYFTYPYEGNIGTLLLALRNNDTPSVKPINSYNYELLSDSHKKCSDNEHLRLVFVIKSALENFERRSVIRNTWGNERRFIDVNIRTVFLLGIRNNDELQQKITAEYSKHGDIVQATFQDTYFNNTIKTMMGFKWAVTVCPKARFYMFVDDDFYVSTKNVLAFIRSPFKYPTHSSVENFNGNEDLDLPDGIRFYGGYAKPARPMRDLFSKWYITLEEYPYNAYPLYVTAGAYIVSKEALVDFYYGSFYTKHFRFDDIYMGILANKINILPFHSNHFYTFGRQSDLAKYKYLIASHGYENSNFLLKTWLNLKSLGYA